MNYATGHNQLFLGAATVTNLPLPRALKITARRSKPSAGSGVPEPRSCTCAGLRRLPKQHIPGALFRVESQVGSAVKSSTYLKKFLAC